MSTVPGTSFQPEGYYNRHEAEEAKHYDEHLVIAGHVGQSAEINEIQSRFKSRVKRLGDHLLRDGDIKEGGELVIPAVKSVAGQSVTRGAGNADVLTTLGTLRQVVAQRNGVVYPSTSYALTGGSIQWLTGAPTAGQVYSVNYSYEVAAGAGRVAVLAQAAEIWLDGAERLVPEATLLVPATGDVEVGVYLLKTVISEVQDPSLRDPAIGLRLVGEAGAARLKVEPKWGYAGDGQAGEFYKVHRIFNGVLQARSETPESNAVAVAIARYDRQSTGGSYVVDGFRVTAIPGTSETAQIYSLSAGTARVAGAEIITPGGQTLEYFPTPEVELIDGEAHISTGAEGQVLTVFHPPIDALESVQIEMLVTDLNVTRSALNSIDTIQEGSTAYSYVTTVEYVKQGGTTFVQYTNASTPYDYRLVGDTLVWNDGPTPAVVNTRPVAGSTFQVKFQYQKEVASTATISADRRTITIPEANVADTEISLRYTYRLPRIDRICIDTAGRWQIVQGIAARYGSLPAYPEIPSNLLGIASIIQTWMDTRRVQNDAQRVVSMARLEAHDRDIQTLYQLVSANNLQNDLAAYSARQPLGRRGVFVDPFLNDFSRDAGVTQTAQITGGTLTLGVEVERFDIRLPDIVTLDPGAMRYRVTQDLSSDSMPINPYLVFVPPKSYASLNPWFSYFSVSQESRLPPTYVDVYEYRTETTGDSWKDGWQIKDFLREEDGGSGMASMAEPARFMPETVVRFELLNWGPDENLVRVTIDGREVAFGAQA